MASWIICFAVSVHTAVTADCEIQAQHLSSGYSDVTLMRRTRLPAVISAVLGLASRGIQPFIPFVPYIAPSKTFSPK